MRRLIVKRQNTVIKTYRDRNSSAPSRGASSCARSGGSRSSRHRNESFLGHPDGHNCHGSTRASAQQRRVTKRTVVFIVGTIAWYFGCGQGGDIRRGATGIQHTGRGNVHIAAGRDHDPATAQSRAGHSATRTESCLVVRRGLVQVGKHINASNLKEITHNT